MTRAPYVVPKSDVPFGRKQQLFDTVLGWRMINPAMRKEWTITLGETAEKVAERYGVSREEQDRFAFDSQMKCKAAVARDVFADEIAPVAVLPPGAGNTVSVSLDEFPRPQTTIEALAKLRPAFKTGGTVTAGNSSGINDGAAALLLCEAHRARVLGLTPLARFVGCAAAGVAPDVMGLGPIPATRKALSRSGFSRENLDLIEINEAFAAQAIACMRDLEFDPARTNVNGGAIALGSSPRCQRRAHRDDAAARAAASRRPLWLGNDVHRRRPRNCNGIRTRRVEGSDMSTTTTTTPKAELLIGGSWRDATDARVYEDPDPRPVRGSPTSPMLRERISMPP